MAETVAICTLGCKVNAYESEAVTEQFVKKGYRVVLFDDVADIYIVNTCTVTHLGDRKSRQMIRRTKQHNPNAVLVVMGCYAQTAPEEVRAIPEVDIILGSGEKSTVCDLAEEFLQNHRRIEAVSDIGQTREFEEQAVTAYRGKSRAFLKVQDGCNQFCSYCIIPYARGRIRSRSISSARAEAETLAQNGFSEIVLVGIHLASYGKDRGASELLELLEQISQVEGIRRIRMGSLEPTLCTEPFVKSVAALPKVCHHFHLSLQSGCDATLLRMNRKYTTDDYRCAVAQIRKYMPDSAITTDIMVGFPGETDEEFQTTCNFAAEIAFAEAHIFKYSVRKGTVAAKMENQTDPAVKEERSHRLMQITDKTAEDFLRAHVHKTMPVLFEQLYKGEKNIYEGKTENYLTVLTESDHDLSGQILPVTFSDVKNNALWGSVSQKGVEL